MKAAREGIETVNGTAVYRRLTLRRSDGRVYLTTRSHGNDYEHELTDTEHTDLVDRLLALEASAVLSGYDHPLYAPLEDAGWTRHGHGMKTDAGAGREAKAAVEVLWCSPHAAGLLALGTST